MSFSFSEQKDDDEEEEEKNSLPLRDSNTPRAGETTLLRDRDVGTSGKGETRSKGAKKDALSNAAPESAAPPLPPRESPPPEPDGYTSSEEDEEQARASAKVGCGR